MRKTGSKNASIRSTSPRSEYYKILRNDFEMNKGIYFLAIPMIIFYLLFHYYPMYGSIVAFKDFVATKGIWGSPWTSMYGLKHFFNFFNSYYFLQLMRNTVVISLMEIIFSFPAPIFFALILNELRHKYFKTAIQSMSYMPHFISLVVICGLIKEFTTTTGLITNFVTLFGSEQSNLLMKPELFRWIYTGSEIWQSIGWSSIIYTAALTGIDPELYESAKIDGASRWKQTWHITLPCISPTVIVMLILKMGKVFSLGFEKIILLYNPLTYETADVISSFVYRRGLLESDISGASAIGLFNSVLNFIILIAANKLSRKLTETSLW
jgi:putative aldouronate transport system permease protein